MTLSRSGTSLPLSVSLLIFLPRFFFLSVSELSSLAPPGAPRRCRLRRVNTKLPPSSGLTRRAFHTILFQNCACALGCRRAPAASDPAADWESIVRCEVRRGPARARQGPARARQGPAVSSSCPGSDGNRGLRGTQHPEEGEGVRERSVRRLCKLI